MVVFDDICLQNDNLRKCTVESRPEVSGIYNGIIYSRQLKEAKSILNKVRKIISKEISTDVPVTMKRGCSEYSHVYPKFKKLDRNCKPVMRYKDEWQVIEDFAEKNSVGAQFNSYHGSFNHPGYNVNDAKVMLTWLKYAATIGDLSYSKITGLPVPKLEDLKRPSFQFVEDEK